MFLSSSWKVGPFWSPIPLLKLGFSVEPVPARGTQSACPCKAGRCLKASIGRFHHAGGDAGGNIWEFQQKNIKKTVENYQLASWSCQGVILWTVMNVNASSSSCCYRPRSFYVTLPHHTTCTFPHLHSSTQTDHAPSCFLPSRKDVWRWCLQTSKVALPEKKGENLVDFYRL